MEKTAKPNATLTTRPPTTKPVTGKTTGRGTVVPVAGKTTRSAPAVSAMRRGAGGGGGGGWLYMICGVVIGLGILYLVNGQDDGSVSTPRAEPERREVRTDFVPSEGSEKTVGEEVVVIERAPEVVSTGKGTLTNDEAIKKFAEATALYELGSKQEGKGRNGYFRDVERICQEIADSPAVSDSIRQEANRLRYSARKGQTL